MKGHNKKLSFKKTADCPASSTLLSYRSERLSPEIATLVRFHLSECEFCTAELPLLAHHTQPQKGECKAPDIPMNLRVLAESLLCKTAKVGIIS